MINLLAEAILFGLAWYSMIRIWTHPMSFLHRFYQYLNFLALARNLTPLPKTVLHLLLCEFCLSFHVLWPILLTRNETFSIREFLLVWLAAVAVCNLILNLTPFYDTESS